MNLAIAAYLLRQHKEPARGLVEIIRAHLLRIAPTMSYAVAQRNNHCISEAAALFIGGSLLNSIGCSDAAEWVRQGRQTLEHATHSVIEEDGTLSQYSTNYQRMALDVLSLVEFWRQTLDLPRFSDRFYSRARAAAKWMFALVERFSGDAPNLGHNDGTWMLPLADATYRDFRPTVQLAYILFNGTRAYSEEGSYNIPIRTLGLQIPQAVARQPSNIAFNDGGVSVLRLGPWVAIVKYPRYTFRPSQCDALHLDLWHAGMNVLRDGGSFSYASSDTVRRYFDGVAAHNTIQFDGREQMPRVGRFLFGEWLQTKGVTPIVCSGEQVSFEAGYVDWQKACHHRRVVLRKSGMVVEDRIGGFEESATLRWRLAPGAWRCSGSVVHGPGFQISVSADVPIIACELVSGEESRYYLQRTSLPVLQVTVNKPGVITSELISV